MKEFKIIDSHCHIFPDKIAEKATKGTDDFYGIQSANIGDKQSLLNIQKRAGIYKSVVLSAATAATQVASINRYIATEVSNHSDKFIGLGTLHAESDDMKRDVEQIISLGLHGVKLHPDIQGFKLDDYRCLKMYELCEGKLPILIHAGDNRYDHSNPNRLMPILDIYKDLIIVGAHFGGWSIWEEATEKLYKYENFYVDTSSSFYSLDKDTAKRLIRRYGADRVLFGSDFPMWSADIELEYLFSLGLTDDELEKILHLNAEKVFSIE